MSELKYYTPSIEEFHVGFEYEYQAGIEEVFIPKVFNGFTSTEQISWVVVSLEHPTCLAPIFYRVKYLDKEDIESLGYKLNEWFISSGKYGGTYKITMMSFGEIPKITIVVKDFIRDNSGDFKELSIIRRLNIKNKSEFKRLLKQLNIQIQ